MDDLDLVEDSDEMQDDELDLPPPLQHNRQSQASSASTSRLNGTQRPDTGRAPSTSDDPAAAMPTPTLGPDDESDADCIKVGVSPRIYCVYTE